MKKKIFTGIALMSLSFTALAGCASASGGDSEKQETVVTFESGARYKQISSDAAAKLMETEKEYVILDVRTASEYVEGHIPKAINIANEIISDETTRDLLKDKDRLILVYCRSGNRSKQAAEKLAELGYTNIVEFGGINTWGGELVK